MVVTLFVALSILDRESAPASVAHTLEPSIASPAAALSGLRLLIERISKVGAAARTVVVVVVGPTGVVVVVVGPTGVVVVVGENSALKATDA